MRCSKVIPSFDALRDAARIVLRVAAIALLTACGGGGGSGFSVSTPVSKYIKAFNTEQNPATCELVPDPEPAKFVGCDQFGSAVALNADGDLLVAGAPFEDNNLGDVNPVSDGNDPLGYNSGAIYTYVRKGTTWATSTNCRPVQLIFSSKQSA
jgi:hypothetical protein